LSVRVEQNAFNAWRCGIKRAKLLAEIAIALLGPTSRLCRQKDVAGEDVNMNAAVSRPSDLFRRNHPKEI
jgi:hypothetical protein